jgi:hypothetical protein
MQVERKKNTLPQCFSTFLVPQTPFPSQSFWYRWPPCLTTVLVPRNPLSTFMVHGPHPLTILLVPHIPLLSTILVPRTSKVLRTPTPLNVSGTAGRQHLWTFLVPRVPTPLNVSGTAGPHPSERFWYRGSPPLWIFLVFAELPLSNVLVPRTSPLTFLVEGIVFSCFYCGVEVKKSWKNLKLRQ